MFDNKKFGKLGMDCHERLFLPGEEVTRILTIPPAAARNSISRLGSSRTVSGRPGQITGLQWAQARLAHPYACMKTVQAYASRVDKADHRSMAGKHPLCTSQMCARCRWGSLGFGRPALVEISSLGCAESGIDCRGIFIGAVGRRRLLQWRPEENGGGARSV